MDKAPWATLVSGLILGKIALWKRLCNASFTANIREEPPTINTLLIIPRDRPGLFIKRLRQWLIRSIHKLFTITFKSACVKKRVSSSSTISLKSISHPDVTDSCIFISSHTARSRDLHRSLNDDKSKLSTLLHTSFRISRSISYPPSLGSPSVSITENSPLPS